MREDANSSDEFHSITYLAEVLLKYEVLVLLGVLLQFDAPEGERIGFEIVSSDGLGVWAQKLPEILNGITIAGGGDYLNYTREYNRKIAPSDSAAYNALEKAREVWRELEEVDFSFGRSRSGLVLFFVALRNRTRGHGATTGSQYERINGTLLAVLGWLVETSSVALLPLLLPMKVKAGGEMACRQLSGYPTQKQAYISGEQVAQIGRLYVRTGSGLIPLPDLLQYERDTDACYFLNGRRKRANGESDFLDYYTNMKRLARARSFEAEPAEKPPSSTQGRLRMDFDAAPCNNVPIVDFTTYVDRSKLQDQLVEYLTGRTINFLSLRGAGGVGKTTLALKVVRQIINNASGFDFVLWFSARDVDLDEHSGPLLRRRQVSSLEACAKLFASLMAPYYGDGASPSVEFFAKSLSSGSDRFLLIFDNFESFDDTSSLQHFIKSNLAFPSKALITSREDAFHGDVPIEVGGMSRNEASDLVRKTARQAGCEPLITEGVVSRIHDATLGNPYAIKLIVNEFARGTPLENIVTRALTEDYLTALFRRSFERAEESAEYLFLLVCMSPPAHLERLAYLCCVGRGYDYDLARRGMLSNHLLDAPYGDTLESSLYRVSWAAEQFARKIIVGHPLQRTVEQDIEFVNDLIAKAGQDLANGTLFQVVGDLKPESGDLIGAQRNKRVLEWLRNNDARSARSYALACINRPGLEDDEIRGAFKHAVELNPADENLWLVWAKFERSRQDYARSLDLIMRAVDVLDSEPPLYDAARVMLNVMSEVEFKASISFTRRGIYTRSLVARFESLYAELSGDSLAVLAWLHLQTDERAQAKKVTTDGLEREPQNPRLLALKDRLAARRNAGYIYQREEN